MIYYELQTMATIHFGLQWLLEKDSKIIEKLVHM